MMKMLLVKVLTIVATCSTLSVGMPPLVIPYNIATNNIYSAWSLTEKNKESGGRLVYR